MAKAKSSEQVTVQSEEKAPEAVVSFEDFLKEYGSMYHPGLVASFKFEDAFGSKGNKLEPRTVKAWILGFEEQSNRTY
jgi:hypothetical protein